MIETSAVLPVSTFVVRFCREWSTAGLRWRGQVDHVQSGETARFLKLLVVLLLPQSRIKGIAQAVAQKVDAQHGQ
jgi:hypothetical protein